jgi:lysozyme
LKTSSAGLELIKRFEGLRLQAYKDSVGVLTIGYGSTKQVFVGQTITSAEAEERLKDDVYTAEVAVNKAFPNLHQLMFDALVSFTFNVGRGWLSKSTLAKYLATACYKEAADELLRWNKAGGKELPGLTSRRVAERDLFLQGYHRKLEL